MSRLMSQTAVASDLQPKPSVLTAKELSQSSALLGASLAFKAPVPPPKPQINTYTGRNGALLAATKADLNNSRADGIGSGLTRSTSASPGLLSLRPNTPASRQQSPSLIAAAKAAAARSTSTPQNGGGPPLKIPPRDPRHLQTTRVTILKDESSIPATNKLVELFESKQRENDRTEVGRTSRRASYTQAPIVSPKPVRPAIPLRLSSRTVEKLPIAQTGSPRPLNNVLSRSGISPSPFDGAALAAARTASPKKLSPIRLPTTEAQLAKIPPALPPSRQKARPKSALVDSKSLTDSAATEDDGSSIYSYLSEYHQPSKRNFISDSIVSPDVNAKPQARPLSLSAVRPRRSPSLQQLPSFPSNVQSPPAPPSLRSRRPSSLRMLTPQLTADSLADAIVASSLASSRVPSPTRIHQPPPPPPRRRKSKSSLFSASLSVFHPSVANLSRTPSPSKGMRHTLRSVKNNSDEEDDSDPVARNRRAAAHRHGLLVRKHPNKHHEGDRKRWRDALTERERRRYEGLWAANRGILLPPSDSGISGLSDDVHDLVVKDIWMRSGLSMAVLEEVWELVAHHVRRDSVGENVSPDKEQQGSGNGPVALGREEFVVGLWLIDQCLKGRKLPIVVGETVWESVRRLQGVVLSQPK